MHVYTRTPDITSLNRLDCYLRIFRSPTQFPHVSCALQNQRAGWPCRVESYSEDDSEEEEEDGVEEGTEGRPRKGTGITSKQENARGVRGTTSNGGPGRFISNGRTGGAGSSTGGASQKYGFRDRNTLKRTDFFTYPMVRLCGEREHIPHSLPGSHEHLKEVSLSTMVYPRTRMTTNCAKILLT